MDNETNTVETVETIAQAPVNTQIDAEAIQAAPSVQTDTSPIQAETPAEIISDAVEDKPEQVTTLLGEPSKEEPANKETETNEVKVNQEGGQSDDPAPPPAEEVVEEPVEVIQPTYDPFVFPEGVSLKEDRIKEFTDILSELELSGKADHAAVQAFGQKAVDFHLNEVQRVAEDLTKLYQTTWEKQKTSWKEEFLADPEIGGNRFQTTVDAANNFIRTHGGTAEEQAEFRQIMESSGLGNHKAVIRILAKAMDNMSEGEPLAATKPVSTPKSKSTTLYGKLA